MSNNWQSIDYKQFVFDYITRATQEVYNFDLVAAEKRVRDPSALIINQITPPKLHLELDVHACVNIFIVAKYLMKHKPKNLKPPEFALQVNQALCEKLNHFAQTDPNTIISSVEPADLFLNVNFKPIYVAQIVEKILRGDYLSPLPPKKDRVMIEYSQPNTHKTFHVGHMRNAALGNALVQMFKYNGYNVTAVNYIGDVGTHIAKCLWYYLTQVQPKTGSKSIEDDVPPNQPRVEFLGQMYSNAVNKLELDNYCNLAFVGYVIARVDSVKPHPKQSKWLLVDVFDGSETHQVVCGGTGFNTGDLVAYAPVGTKKGGRLITRIEKEGEVSEGCILSEKELELSENNNKIKVFTKEDSFLTQPIAPGMELTEASRKLDTDVPKNENVARVITERNQQVKQMLRAMEEGEPKITALWNLTRQWSIDDFKQIYQWTESHFDFDFHESDVGEEAKKMCYDAYEKGILVKSEGAIGADLSEVTFPGSKQKLGFVVLITGAGTGLYATKDLALAKKKFEEFEIDRSIYVVDAGQSLHFQQVFKTLELLGFKQAEKCFHLAYGIVTLKEGKMSSRKGTVIFFSELKKDLTDHIMGIIKSNAEKHNVVFSQEEMDEICRKVSVAAIKYGMLNQDSSKNIVFDLEQWASPLGNTGVYMMYAYTRTQSILRQVTLEKGEKNLVDLHLLNDPSELKLMNILSQFKETATQATENYKPHQICVYVYSLSKQFSRWYDTVSVKNASTPALKATRLELVDATGRVIKKCLELLGISTVERM